jgi:hypothetical protein
MSCLKAACQYGYHEQMQYLVEVGGKPLLDISEGVRFLHAASISETRHWL